MGIRKNSFDIYRQFGHAPSKRFARHGLQQSSPSQFFKFHTTLCFRSSYLASKWWEGGRMVASASRMSLC
jgi:hypothetical protein